MIERHERAKSVLNILSALSLLLFI